ncbi:MAG: alpha,3-galactosidase [Ferruginibacter sp.]|uniref:alpha-1,3-galactosidase-related protein n=1 Tax=Ferruginibacter sp. TaxID=1940288 RepID=UPI0026589248|nr:right-handed parallel beta-helix repeat-containing protein [Ferruginibacter sp.]MDB5279691.1 alpha,3-galactosidase [Ferruginibacter sp.]
MKQKIALCLLTSLIFFNTLIAQDTVSVAGFGYKPDSRINAVPFVQKAIAACKKNGTKVLVFPKGRYDFWPQYVTEKLYYESNTDVIPFRRCPILFEGVNNLMVDCSGSEFIFHDRMQPFTIDNCNNITIRNVSIDWDIPLTAQAQIIVVTNEYIDIAINATESPFIIEKGKLVFVGEGWKSEWWGVMEFDKVTKLVAPGTGDEGCLGGGYDGYTAAILHDGLVRLNYNFKRKPAVGNYLVLRHSARDHAGTFITGSKNVTIENMDMYHNAGLGILSQYSENLTFRKVSAVPNPAKDRILSGHDDGLHFSNCKGQITVDSCRFAALMDDPVNVHGTSVQVIEKLGDKKLLCKLMHEQSIGFTWANAGEKVGFIENEAMNTFATGIVESWRARDSVLFEISFKEALPAALAAGDALENLTWVPDVLIKNSFFGSNRARGILMSTPGKVVIENNVFESSGSAILIPGDANGWFESGAVKDVTIRNNTFNDPCLTSMYQFCEGIISIDPEIPKMDIAKPFHRNIRIEGNTFNPFDYPVLYAKSTEGLYFNNNIIRRSNRFTPFHKRQFMITLEACKKIEIAGNKLEGDVLGKNIRLVGTPVSSVKLGKKQGIVIAGKQ